MQTFDLIVIGAGVAGSAVAYRAAGGRRVLVLEQYPFVHAFGSSHGGSRIFRHAYEDARYVRMCQQSEELWRELERDSGESLLVRSGGLDIAPRAHPDLDRIESALREAGSVVERLDAPEVERRFPAMRLDASEEALWQPSAGVLAADRAVLAMLRTAARRGAELHEREPALAIGALPDGVRVRTHRGSYAAPAVVVAAGAWLGRFLPEAAARLTVERQQVLYVDATPAAAFEPGRFPVFIHRELMVYGLPILERPTAIKVSNHTGAPAIRLDERDFELNEPDARRSVEAAGRLIPGLASTWSDYQTCLYTKTPDEHFILGRHPDHPGVTFGGGFSGHGFKFGPLLGDLLLEVVDGGSAPHPELFDPGRAALLGAAGRAPGPAAG
jgi:sarcosine oxidase